MILETNFDEALQLITHFLSADPSGHSPREDNLDLSGPVKTQESVKFFSTAPTAAPARYIATLVE